MIRTFKSLGRAIIPYGPPFPYKPEITTSHKTHLKPTFMDSFMYLQYWELQKKISSKMAAMAVILNHATQKIDRCATVNPLKQPEPKTKEIGKKKSKFFEIQDVHCRPFWIQSYEKRISFGHGWPSLIGQSLKTIPSRTTKLNYHHFYAREL